MFAPTRNDINNILFIIHEGAQCSGQPWLATTILFNIFYCELYDYIFKTIFLCYNNLIKLIYMIIVTHNEKFHADEVFACAVLLLVFPKAEIMRSRNEDDFKKADIRVDVGEKNNPETLDFDHHQKGGAGFRDNGCPYASFGLVWKEFGSKICGSKEAFEKVDRKLVQTIDALDFGYDFFTYSNIYPYTISDMISAFNTSWEEENDSSDAFFELLKIAKKIIEREVIKANGILNAKDFIEKAIKYSPSIQYLILEKNCPWKDVIKYDEDFLYVIFPSSSQKWMAQAVPERSKSFQNKKDFPEAWAGLRSEELQKVTGVDDALFCHPNKFICAAGSKEGIIKMVELALE